MKIRVMERLGTGLALAATVLIASAIGWAYSEVEVAGRQRLHAIKILHSITESRLVTFEYRVSGLERARLQGQAVLEGIDRLIAESTFLAPEELRLVDTLRKNNAAAKVMMAEMSSTPITERAGRLRDVLWQRFEDQILGRLLIYQQDSLDAAFRLTELTVERMVSAQRDVMAVILAGLALIVAILLSASWQLNRMVLRPIVNLQRSAGRVAAGDWSQSFASQNDNEIGQLAQSLDSMTRSLQESYAQIERSNRELVTLNEELTAFSYSVSHDLRAPLRGMDGFSLALLEDYGDRLGAEGKDFLLRIRSGSQRMGQLIDDLLVLSRVTRTELKLEPVDLSVLAREIADSLRREQPERDVTWRIEDKLTLRADRNLMHRLLHNLLENAWKFTSATSGATIHVGARQHEGRTGHFVADNGVGFDMAHADRLFSPFQRLHRASEFPGTGIGLAIVQRIVRRHGGRIWFEAKEGEGATFTFTLGDPENE